MADNKKYWGISICKSVFQGEVISNPKFFDNGTGGELATLELLMYINELSSNGQWVDVENVVPITVMDQSKVEAVRKYVQAGRQLYLETYYKSWVAADGSVQHANVATKIVFGYKPKDENKSDQVVGAGPPVPQPVH